MKFAIKGIRLYPPHLRHVAKLLCCGRCSDIEDLVPTEQPEEGRSRSACVTWLWYSEQHLRSAGQLSIGTRPHTTPGCRFAPLLCFLCWSRK